MKQLSHLYNKISALRGNKGFTMIELLIVIAILGILAVAVLSAINPLEQINRGRDTGSQSDAEQLLNAIERFNAFQGHFPWDANKNAAATDLNPMIHVNGPTIAPAWNVVGSVSPFCNVLDRLGDGGAGNCSTGADELKQSFINRVGTAAAPRGLYVFKQDEQPSTNVYVCFVPQSGAFREAAKTTCQQDLATDHPRAEACGTGFGTTSAAGITIGTTTGIYLSCLP